MNWEEKLRELSGYDIAFEIKQGYYHISLKYQDNWNIIVPENENIYVEQRNGICHYIASTDSITIDEMFKVIDNTIEYNTDLEKKLELFKEKVAKLQELFSTESYKKLKTIEFVFPKQKKSSKKKLKETTVEEIPISDANSVSVIEDIPNDITSISTGDYDSNEEVVVTMQNDFIEELERK